MLKKRVKKWDLDRNHKQADMMYALKIAFERESQGKKTAFIIRGRVVPFEEVQHYFRRKGVRDVSSLMNEATAAEPTTRIECHTPGPFFSQPAGQPFPTPGPPISSKPVEASGQIIMPSINVIPDLNQVERLMSQPLELSQLDVLLRYGCNYYTSFFEGSPGRHWRSQQRAFAMST